MLYTKKRITQCCNYHIHGNTIWHFTFWLPSYNSSNYSEFVYENERSDLYVEHNDNRGYNAAVEMCHLKWLAGTSFKISTEVEMQ